MKKLVALLFVVMLMALPAVSPAQERGFATPEACAQALLNAIKAQDIQAMDACIAFDELAASFDFVAQSERLRAIMGNMSYLPASAPYAAAYNGTLLRRAWYGRLATFGMGERDGALEALYTGRTYNSNSPEYAAVLEAVQMTDACNVFPCLTYEGLVRPDEIAAVSEIYYSERNQENMRKAMAVWQVETFEERGIRISTTVETRYTEGVQYIIPVRFVEIGGRWLADPNVPVLAQLLGMSVFDLAVALP